MFAYLSKKVSYFLSLYDRSAFLFGALHVLLLRLLQISMPNNTMLNVVAWN